MTDREVRVGVIGAGWVAKDRHIPAFRRSHGATVEAILDPSPAAATETAKRFRIPHAFHRLDYLLEQPLDAVTVCTPPSTHAEIVEAALNAGKHVLVEKPLSLTADEGRSLQGLAEEKGLVLSPAHNFLFSRSARKADEILGGGRAGEVRWAMGLQLSSPRRRLPTEPVPEVEIADRGSR